MRLKNIPLTAADAAAAAEAEKLKKPKSNRGRKSKYSPDLCDKIVDIAKKAPHGLQDVQIAEELDIAVSTLYDWAAIYPDFDYAMCHARTIRHSRLFKQNDDNHVTYDNVRFYDRSNIDMIKMSGYHRNLRCLRGVKTLDEGSMALQDALARGEISIETCDMAMGALQRKAAIAEKTTMEERLKKIEAEMGINK